MHRHDLSDDHWSLVLPFIPQSTARTGRPPSDPRLMLNGIFWILGTGATWRDLPERYGPWQTVYDHFRNWRKGGVFASVVGALQVKLDRSGNGSGSLFGRQPHQLAGLGQLVRVAYYVRRLSFGFER